MALPKLNDSPKYSLVIPSTQQTVHFRPYLVKEEKVLLMAFESGDEQSTLRAVLDTIESCIQDKFNKNKLTTFDVEYMFTQIRAKSVGEKTKIGVKCEHCGIQNEIEINLEEVQVSHPEKKSNIIKLTDDISLEMRYPSYRHLAEGNVELNNSPKNAFTLITKCIDAIRTEDERISLDDEPQESVDEFLESMTGGQFAMLAEFLQDMPKTTYHLQFTCTDCKEENDRTIEGMQNFF